MAGKERGPSHRVVSSFPLKQWELFESLCAQAGMDGRQGLKHLVGHCAITGSFPIPNAIQTTQAAMASEDETVND